MYCSKSDTEIRIIFDKFCLLRKVFDFLRNSRPTVPMYADGRELLVFRTFSAVCQRAEKVFRHAGACLRQAFHLNSLRAAPPKGEGILYDDR